MQITRNSTDSTSHLRECNGRVGKEWWKKSKIDHKHFESRSVLYPNSYDSITHLEDFLHGRVIDSLKCGRTRMEVFEELKIGQNVNSRL